MPTVRFPEPHTASPEGVVAIGGDLQPDTLMAAYRQGIFPWPHEGLPLLWFSPPARGVLEFADLHVPRSLVRVLKRHPFHVTIDRAFIAVMRCCADTPRPNQDGTWITRDVLRAYTRLHRLGIAHSVEVWEGKRLVGGIYGIDIDGAFAAESMFYHRTNASKVALFHLVDHLRSRGLDWIDIQVLSPHLARVGAKSIDRPLFLEKLKETRGRHLSLFDREPEATALSAHD